jgi:DNA polymerase III delta' subunit
VSAHWQREGKRAAAAAEPAPAVRLAPPLGQGVLLAAWVARARALRLPHAVVVEGARGSGKTTVLQWLAAALLCPSELDTEGPCGVCRTCLRVAADLHPDLHVITRAQDEDDHKQEKKSFYVLKVGQIRAAQDRLTRSPVEGRARVLVIADADTMEEEAQNALLKTLEEPGRDTFLLLEAARPEQLLPTVRSRVQRLRVLPLADAVLAEEIRRRIAPPPQRLEAAVALAAGSLGLGLLAGTERVVQLHDLVRAVLATTQGLRPVATARAVLAGADERRHELEQARTFLWLLRAELRAQGYGLAASAAGSYPAPQTEPWTSWLELTLAAERDLDLLIPPEQVLTACLVGFVARGLG